MAKIEQLKITIDDLKESIRLDWLSLAEMRLTHKERIEIRQHVASCTDILQDLINRLERIDHAQRP